MHSRFQFSLFNFLVKILNRREYHGRNELRFMVVSSINRFCSLYHFMEKNYLYGTFTTNLTLWINICNSICPSICLSVCLCAFYREDIEQRSCETVASSAAARRWLRAAKLRGFESEQRSCCEALNPSSEAVRLFFPRSEAVSLITLVQPCNISIKKIIYLVRFCGCMMVAVTMMMM